MYALTEPAVRTAGSRSSKRVLDVGDAVVVTAIVVDRWSYTSIKYGCCGWTLRSGDDGDTADDANSFSEVSGLNTGSQYIPTERVVSKSSSVEARWEERETRRREGGGGSEETKVRVEMRSVSWQRERMMRQNGRRMF